MWELDYKESWSLKNFMVLNSGVGKDSWECLGIARRLNQSILNEISPEYSMEGLADAETEDLILWPHDEKNWLTAKYNDVEKDWRQRDKGTTEDETAAWHYRLNGHECEQALGVGDGQGSLECYSPWGQKESDMTEQLTELNWTE